MEKDIFLHNFLTEVVNDWEDDSSEQDREDVQEWEDQQYENFMNEPGGPF